MSKKIDKRIQKEYDRIAKGPHTGWFTLLHHEGLALERSHNVIERLDFILAEKPEHERLCRLINIVWVSEPALAEYEKVKQQALAEYQKVTQQALAEYQKVKQPALAEYQKVTQPAWAEYEKVTQPAWAEYEKVKQTALKKLNPRTTWNGKTIFGKRTSRTRKAGKR
jgi:hypothetical protein